MDYITIIRIVCVAVSLVLDIIGLVILLRKKGIAKLSAIIQDIPSYINQAEQLLGAGKGLAKLMYVLSQIRTACAIAGVKYDEKTMTEKIEEILQTPQSHSEKLEKGE